MLCATPPSICGPSPSISCSKRPATKRKRSCSKCGEAVLDEGLRRRALGNQASEASRTFVVVDRDQRVFGYDAMAAGAVSHPSATSAVRTNMPDPIPVMVLARLGVLRALWISGLTGTSDDLDAPPGHREGLTTAGSQAPLASTLDRRSTRGRLATRFTASTSVRRTGSATLDRSPPSKYTSAFKHSLG